MVIVITPLANGDLRYPVSIEAKYPGIHFYTCFGCLEYSLRIDKIDDQINGEGN